METKEFKIQTHTSSSPRGLASIHSRGEEFRRMPSATGTPAWFNRTTSSPTHWTLEYPSHIGMGTSSSASRGESCWKREDEYELVDTRKLELSMLGKVDP